MNITCINTDELVITLLYALHCCQFSVDSLNHRVCYISIHTHRYINKP